MVILGRFGILKAAPVCMNTTPRGVYGLKPIAGAIPPPITIMSVERKYPRPLQKIIPPRTPMMIVDG